MSAAPRREGLEEQRAEHETRWRERAGAVKLSEEALSALEHGGCEANLHRETDAVGRCRLPPDLPRVDPSSSPCRPQVVPVLTPG